MKQYELTKGLLAKARITGDFVCGPLAELLKAAVALQLFLPWNHAWHKEKLHDIPKARA